jgi:hypothetical protein
MAAAGAQLMTDDSNLTPGGEMNDAATVTVEIRTDADGHWVDWSKGEESGSLGPYQEVEVAENVRSAKELELTHNDKRIDQV